MRLAWNKTMRMNHGVDSISLSEQMRVSLARQMKQPSTPERSDLLQQVVGVGGDATGYIYGGLTTALGIRATIQACGRDISQFRRILDFGCGSGRVLRWFGDIADRTSLVGVDINSDAIDWCRRNVPFGKFDEGPYWPPLDFPDKSFDLIYGISVFTHLDQEFETAWMMELRRLLRPGGVLLLSFHGADKALRGLSADEYKTFGREGFLYKRGSGASVAGLPEFYQIAFHSDRYIKRKWGRHFRIRGSIEHGPMYEQTLVSFEPRTFLQWLLPSRVPVGQLPLASIDAPVVGTQIVGSIKVEGWSFSMDTSMGSVDLWIDGCKFDTCSVEVDQPGIRHVFGLPDHLLTGFHGVFSPEGLSEGPHILWITPNGGDFPLAATYFRI